MGIKEKQEKMCKWLNVIMTTIYTKEGYLFKFLVLNTEYKVFKVVINSVCSQGTVAS